MQPQSMGASEPEGIGGNHPRSFTWMLGIVGAGLMGAALIFYLNASPVEATRNQDSPAEPTSSSTAPFIAVTSMPTTSVATAPTQEPISSATSPSITLEAEIGCEIDVPPDEEPIVYYSDPVCLNDFGIVSVLEGNAEYALVYHHSGSDWRQVESLQLSAVRLQYELEELGMPTAEAAALCRQWAPSDYHCGLEQPLTWLLPGQFGPDIVLGETPLAAGIEALEKRFGPVAQRTTCDQWVPESGLSTVEVWAWDRFGILSWPNQEETVDGYHVLEPGLATEHGLQVGDSYIRVHSLVDVVHEWQWGGLNVFTIGDPGDASGEEYRGGILSASAKVGEVTQLTGGWDCYTPTH